MKIVNTKLTFLTLFLLMQQGIATSALAQVPLNNLLRHALRADPTIAEAQANIAIAESQTKISQAGHLPIISVTDTQMLAQRHRDDRDRRHSSLGLHGTINLYAWGGIEASVERDKHKHNFQQHKLFETREFLGMSVGRLYLNALRAKESIQAYQKSLARHKKMLRDVRVIAQYDEGRSSETTEIQSRLLNVEATIAEQQRILHTSLSKLSRYSTHPLKPEDLVDPFAKTQPKAFLQQYQNPDIYNNPSFRAQNEELESARADTKVAKAKRLPAVNLEGGVNNRGYEIYLGVSWNLFDSAASNAVDQSHYSEEAAKAKLNNILLEVQEQARTAEVEMLQNSQRLNVLRKQIVAQKKVVSDYELQFQIAQRSLLDVLNAYQELTSVEIAEINAANDFRDAALAYLASQSKISNWAGITQLNLTEK